MKLLPTPPIDLLFIPDIFYYNMWNSTCHALLCLFADMFSTEQRLASHEITASSLCILNNITFNKTGNERVALRRFRAKIIAVEKINIIHYECVFVALGVQYVMHMRHIAICDLSASTVFFHIFS